MPSEARLYECGMPSEARLYKCGMPSEARHLEPTIDNSGKRPVTEVSDQTLSYRVHHNVVRYALCRLCASQHMVVITPLPLHPYSVLPQPLCDRILQRSDDA